MSTISLSPGCSAGSVRSLYLEMLRDETILATGSGFIACTGHFRSDKKLRIGLATAKHNLTGTNFFTGQSNNGKDLKIPNNVRVYFPEIINGGLNFFSSIYDLGESPNEKFFSSNNADVAFLNLRKDDISRVCGVSIFDLDSSQFLGKDFSVGSEVQILGHPIKRFSPNYLATSSFGKIAYEPSVSFPFKDKENCRELDAYLVNARTFSGQSGSLVYRHVSCHPYLNGCGEFMSNSGAIDVVVGLYSSRINPHEDEFGNKPDSDLGLVWRASALFDVLQLLPPADLPNA